MISCDKGKTCVIGRGDVILAEWTALTLTVIRGFVKSGKDKVSQEKLEELVCKNLETAWKEAFGNKTYEEIEEEKGKTLEKLLLGSLKS